MMRHVLFDLSLFGSGDDREKAEKNLLWMLEALCQRNQAYLRDHPNTPPLYKSGVRYEVPQQFNGEIGEVQTLRSALGRHADRPEVQEVLGKIQDALGGEVFRDIGRLYNRGFGDCDNLACARVAELRQAGIPADPYMTSRKRPDGGTTYHALVLWPALGNVVDDNGNTLGDDGERTTEDPSLILGMAQPQRAADRLEELRKNRERTIVLEKLRTQKRGAFAGLEDALAAVLSLHRPEQPIVPRSAPPMSERELAKVLGRDWRGGG